MALTDNLVASWKLSDLTDVSGNAHTLTNNNTVTFVTGKIGNAANLVRASNQTLSIANGSLGDLNPVGTAYSISLWFYIESIGFFENQYLINTYSSGGYRINVSSVAGTKTLVLTNSGDTVSGIATGTGAWHHIVMSVSSGGAIKYCYDGTYVEPSSSPVAPAISFEDFYIGGSAAGSAGAVNGKIDAVQFWSRTLSEAEMLESWNSGSGVEVEPPSATVPAAIDDLAATRGANKLTFTWTAPDDGGATISFYSLYLNGVEYESEVTSPHVVTGLPGGVSSGVWTVTATNSEGESDPSNEVTATPIAPSAGGFRCGLIK
jgi:hypothetical protein